MECLSLVAPSSSRPLVTAQPRNPRGLPTSPLRPLSFRGHRRRRTVSALGHGAPRELPEAALEKISKHGFASLSSSEGTQTSSVGTSPYPVSSPPSSIGSPLFWIGVGVAFSALFSWAANNLKKYAMQQALKSMMSQMPTEKGSFGNSSTFPGQPFPFPTSPVTASPPSQPASSSSQPAISQPAAAATTTVDVLATKVESTSSVSSEIKEETQSIKSAFVDVSPEEVLKGSSSEDFSMEELLENGSTVKQEKRQEKGDHKNEYQPGTQSPFLSVDALEKMMEDPTVQKMVYPYLPEEMRNPVTFKWMLQNPQYRQQLQDMLDKMGGSKEWDTQIMESLKNFDLNSPEVKQQFDQIGLSPEEVISKIMANPDIAMSFQNPRVQAAIMECSENPLNIQKYQDDMEVMEVFNKISQLFPGVPGPF